MPPAGVIAHGRSASVQAGAVRLRGSYQSAGTMVRVALIEDDVPTSNQMRGWLEGARDGIRVDQYFTRDDAAQGLTRERYDLVVLDVELGRERHAGIAIINSINRQHPIPVLVVSGLPAGIYRSIMKALDAWDYLQKSDFDESEFVETFLGMLRAAQSRSGPLIVSVSNATNELSLDPLRQHSPLWRGQRINLPLTSQRILDALYQRRGHVVSYDALFQVVKSGRNRDNVRKHVSTIREAFREIDPQFDLIENIPMRGFRWAER
jgi:two-component system, OmpR family, response regulator ChvI